MRTIIFTIYDEKAQVFLPPFFVPTLGIATRAFSDCINSEDHQFAKHPQDYTLFQLGEFFDHDASFEVIDRKSLGNGVEYLNENPLVPTQDTPHGPPDTPIQPDKTR